MNENVLGQIKEKLLAEKKRLEEKLGKFAKKSSVQGGQYTTQWEDYGDDEDENAAEVAAYGDSLGLEQTFESELQDVLAALQRIEDGTYGACTSCDNPIDEKRLLVRPQSGLCMNCMEK